MAAPTSWWPCRRSLAARPAGGGSRPLAHDAPQSCTYCASTFLKRTQYARRACRAHRCDHAPEHIGQGHDRHNRRRAAMTLAEAAIRSSCSSQPQSTPQRQTATNYACGRYSPEQYGPDDVMHVALYSEHYAASVEQHARPDALLPRATSPPCPLRPRADAVPEQDTFHARQLTTSARTQTITPHRTRRRQLERGEGSNVLPSTPHESTTAAASTSTSTPMHRYSWPRRGAGQPGA